MLLVLTPTVFSISVGKLKWLNCNRLQYLVFQLSRGLCTKVSSLSYRNGAGAVRSLVMVAGGEGSALCGTSRGVDCATSSVIRHLGKSTEYSGGNSADIE